MIDMLNNISEAVKSEKNLSVKTGFMRIVTAAIPTTPRLCHILYGTLKELVEYL